ncbi:MAG: hypothetical protein COA79_11080 [Planctomycetota bacterium]|nr:MAG: hypothetical protein COA79_11080 [Planctomycetota bacterium]
MANSKDFLLEEEELKKVAESLCEPIGSTIGTNIQKSAKAVFKEIICHTVGDKLSYEGGQFVNSFGSIKGAISGSFYVLFPTGEALNVAGTMMMMEGDELLNFINDGYGADAEDGFKEVMSQVTGQCSSVLRNMYKEANGDLTSTKDIDILEDLKEFEADIEGDEFVFLKYEMTFEGEESFDFFWVLSKELAFSMAPLEGAEDLAINDSESENLDSGSEEDELTRNVDVLRQIRVNTIVSLAQKRMTIEEILKQICVGSIIEFNVPFDSNLDLSIGNTKIGEGEVVTVNDVYGLQLKSIMSPRKTLEAISLK